MVPVAQLVRASGCGPEGRGFKSRLAPAEKGGDTPYNDLTVCLKDSKFNHVVKTLAPYRTGLLILSTVMDRCGFDPRRGLWSGMTEKGSYPYLIG